MLPFLYSWSWRAEGTGGGCFVCTYSPPLAGSTASHPAPQGRRGHLTVTLLQDLGKSVSEESPVLYPSGCPGTVFGSELPGGGHQPGGRAGLQGRGTGQVLLLTLLRLLLLSRGEGRCRRRDGRGCWCSQGDRLSANVHKTLPKQRQLRVTSAWGLSGTPAFPEKLHMLSV